MNNTMLQSIHEAFSAHFSDMGEVCIAGGAVRDALMEREPKDFDVFILMGSPMVFKESKLSLNERLGHMANAKILGAEIEWHKSEPFWVNNVTYLGKKVQILASPYDSVNSLIDSFDWNVCLFAYGKDGVAQLEQIENIGPSKDLRLHRLTFPLSSLRRGFRFSERFGMRLPYEELDKILDELQRVRANKEKRWANLKTS